MQDYSQIYLYLYSRYHLDLTVEPQRRNETPKSVYHRRHCRGPTQYRREVGLVRQIRKDDIARLLSQYTLSVSMSILSR